MRLICLDICVIILILTASHCLHFLLIDQHPVQSTDGNFSGFKGLEVHKSKALRTVLVTGHLQKERCDILMHFRPTLGSITPLTLQDKMVPKGEKISRRASLLMDFSRFLMKMFPTPLLRSDGSRWHHIILMGLPFITSKFMLSNTRSADITNIT